MIVDCLIVLIVGGVTMKMHTWSQHNQRLTLVQKRSTAKETYTLLMCGINEKSDLNAL